MINTNTSTIATTMQRKQQRMTLRAMNAATQIATDDYSSDKCSNESETDDYSSDVFNNGSATADYSSDVFSNGSATTGYSNDEWSNGSATNNFGIVVNSNENSDEQYFGATAAATATATECFEIEDVTFKATIFPGSDDYSNDNNHQ